MGVRELAATFTEQVKEEQSEWVVHMSRSVEVRLWGDSAQVETVTLPLGQNPSEDEKARVYPLIERMMHEGSFDTMEVERITKTTFSWGQPKLNHRKDQSFRWVSAVPLLQVKNYASGKHYFEMINQEDLKPGDLFKENQRLDSGRYVKRQRVYKVLRITNGQVFVVPFKSELNKY